jgi:hypothetical protein
MVWLIFLNLKRFLETTIDLYVLCSDRCEFNVAVASKRVSLLFVDAYFNNSK